MVSRNIYQDSFRFQTSLQVVPKLELGRLASVHREGAPLTDHGPHKQPDSQAAEELLRKLLQYLPQARKAGRTSECAQSFGDFTLYHMTHLQSHLHMLLLRSQRACDRVAGVLHSTPKSLVDSLLAMLDRFNDYILSDFLRLLAFASPTQPSSARAALPTSSRIGAVNVKKALKSRSPRRAPLGKSRRDFAMEGRVPTSQHRPKHLRSLPPLAETFTSKGRPHPPKLRRPETPREQKPLHTGRHIRHDQTLRNRPLTVPENITPKGGDISFAPGTSENYYVDDRGVGANSANVPSVDFNFDRKRILIGAQTGYIRLRSTIDNVRTAGWI
mmetsp:Transcript_4395/g.5911  ORF Transcript_4395/g.5911 Transcript_4395/m.5911 type:complete len:329 (+) Transcript_4395:191-1177(+)